MLCVHDRFRVGSDPRNVRSVTTAGPCPKTVPLWEASATLAAAAAPFVTDGGERGGRYGSSSQSSAAFGHYITSWLVDGGCWIVVGSLFMTEAPAECADAARYTATVNGRHLTSAVVRDTCTERRMILD